MVHSKEYIQFSRSVMSDFLQHHGLQHARPPYPSTTPRVYSNSCPLSHWCHPTISSSVVSFLPAFNLSQHQCLFKWVSFSQKVAKVLEFQLQHQSFPLISRLISFRKDWLDLLAVQGTVKSLFQHHSSKASILWCSGFFSPTLTSIHDYWKKQTFVGKVMSMLFNMLSMLVMIGKEISIISDM